MRSFSYWFAINLLLTSSGILADALPTSSHQAKHHTPHSKSASAISRTPLLSLSNMENIRSTGAAVVVIDPGHGGKDPGASGAKGAHEKNIVLAISNYLQNDLNQYAGIKVAMTRDADFFVTLRGRLSSARENNGDVFVAIHADSYLNNSAEGASVFALSEHGATSEAAHWLANRENAAVLGGAKFQTNSKMVQSVLLNLSQTATIADSLDLGKQIIQQLNKVAYLHTGHVEQAPFMVLKSPDIPSVLVETGFISNTGEEKRLSSPAYQHALAKAIAIGIVNYLYHNPPQNSIIALQQAGRLTIITKKAEKLTAIARSYNISPLELSTINSLSGEVKIAAGVKLKIPVE